MSHEINISLNGRFFLEINRIKDCNITEFTSDIRKRFPSSDGFKVDLYLLENVRRRVV